MTWIKICGTTNLEDAQTAVEAGADALGFVFHEKSPRNIDPQKAKEIVAQLPKKIEKVGVFVSQSAQEIADLAGQIGLTVVQLHRGEQYPAIANDSSYLTERRLKFIEVCCAQKLDNGGLFLRREFVKHVYALMFDSGSTANPGGTGKTFDWQQARGLVQTVSMTIPVIVAGGLTPQNVAEAVNLFQPFGVDVVSGVEARPGKKDPDKVRAFIKAVRAADTVVA